jgi:lysophospholipase L1-like esterase
VSRNPAPLARALVGLIFLSLLLGGLGGLPAQAAGDPLRVLLTGDSITQGFNGDYTWRYRLYKEFQRQGVPVNFVGSKRSPVVKPGYSSSQYADPRFDTDHFAKGGSTLLEHVGWITQELRDQNPDVVVLEAGINDLRNGRMPAEVNNRLNDWITNVRAVQPTVPIVITPVLGAIDYDRPWLADRIKMYNDLQRATIQARNASEPTITLADTSGGWNPSVHTAENLHPNATGETIIAQHVAETFHTLGLLPRPITMTVNGKAVPSIYKWTAWDRQPRVRVVLRNQRAVLSWDAQAVNGARVWIQRQGHRASFPTTIRGGGTLTTSRLVPKATYYFRISLVRGRMATPLGPVTRVTVKRAARPARPAAVTRLVVDAKGVHWSPSTLATRYLVKLRTYKAKRWTTVRTARTAVSATSVVRAQVWALNSRGRSPVRHASR